MNIAYLFQAAAIEQAHLTWFIAFANRDFISFSVSTLAG
jgi:hypothetical protein